MRKTMMTALAAALLMASSAPAQAQDDVSQESGPVELAPSTQFQGTTNTGAPAAAPQAAAGAFRVYGGLRIGVGGGFKPIEPDADYISTSPATPGIQVGAEYLLMKYFAVGLETRMNWARTRSFNDRIMLWDLVVKPRGNYQLSSMPVELYAALPFGLSVANMPEDNATGKAGATFGLSGGANYFFNSHFGLNLEMGWLWHWVRREEDDPLEGTVKAKARLGQWTLVSVNFMYAF